MKPMKLFVGVCEEGVEPQELNQDTLKLDSLKVRELLNVQELDVKRLGDEITISDTNPLDGKHWGNFPTEISFDMKMKPSEARRLRRTLFPKQRIPRKLKKAGKQIRLLYELSGETDGNGHNIIRGCDIRQITVTGRRTRWTMKFLALIKRLMDFENPVEFKIAPPDIDVLRVDHEVTQEELDRIREKYSVDIGEMEVDENGVWHQK